MKHFPILEAVTLNVLLASCATTTNESTHLHCAEYGPQSVATPYCCYYKDGYCQRTCYNYEIKNTCINWECDEGFLKKETEKKDLKWWQFAGAYKCVPQN
jgi:hypothetical protein